ncbi:tRNA pseudouridine(38-40) synthase TruA [Heyndrickxia ginsengihumi]|uniref:tRNA pseudouridine synthase A n=1 Tax=Heyndrickxia ginsengihumi TaxID=363870 RepID=A0A0A6VGF4_9BACI|nr:tRNA pseudouridine(38-40) synthase TruA [Heyndrickxia ginsengihumi]KHD85709.1 tRNA pseudouridine synthase A [Heyndrickxia ginsengihumi]MBE6184354.1 tRNA pseudouridine(38-40) synthase TruA [Bacillus sp. (in: firmicutes)]MCM3024263.1 tRNA pseudouridine(38-40) synthase TruA [Heyndrickxia ginsengihumi]NEY20914.1 tRNA pseudouridine(38-40) synthase TruA [Heyndrickxia ginsengihumi]
MKRYKCIVSYDGSQFSGYQVQPNKRTVQSEIEQALATIHKGEVIKIFASGRTDAGVHAKGQVIHFDSPLSIPIEKWPIVLNGLLPDDIAILKTEIVDDHFHARFSTVGKAYQYRMYQSPIRDPLKRKYAYQVPYQLDFEAMKLAAEQLLGTHDFTSFCSAKTEVNDKVRTLKEISFYKTDEEWVIQFVGNGFLYNMVRILVGTLLEVGTGRKKPEDMRPILEKRDRSAAGKTAPAEGLYLWKVFY